MYSVSDKFLKLIKADNREFSVKLEIHAPTERTLTGATIQSVSVDEVVNSTDALTLGCACSNKVTVNLINAPRDIDYENACFTVLVGLKLGEMPTVYEYVPLGKFYVADAETSNDFKNLTLVGYDGFCKMTDVYGTLLSGETTLHAVYDDLKGVLSSKGITLKDREFAFNDKKLSDYTINFTNIKDITYQQAIAYIAGCLGGFARFDREGNLEIATYTKAEGIVIDRSLQYMNGFKRLTDKPLTITSISTGTKDNAITCGEGANGTNITFENPYITEDMAEKVVFAMFDGFTYTPCQLKWRGNPCVQAGDIVTALDKDGKEHNVLVMSQSIKIGGGLNSTIECKGKSETTAKFSSNFESASQKIDRVYTTLEQAILNATNAITGNKGGYVILHDTPDSLGNRDGFPDEILIMDTNDIKTATNVWRWNKEGLGHSSTGYNGPYGDFAITADGQINADFITIGSLSANMIAVEGVGENPSGLGKYFRVIDGKVYIGDSDNALELRLAPDEVGFYENDNRKAFFGPHSFELDKLAEGNIEGRFRIQNFGYVIRDNGNMSFKKMM